MSEEVNVNAETSQPSEGMSDTLRMLSEMGESMAPLYESNTVRKEQNTNAQNPPVNTHPSNVPPASTPPNAETKVKGEQQADTPASNTETNQTENKEGENASVEGSTENKPANSQEEDIDSLLFGSNEDGKQDVKPEVKEQLKSLAPLLKEYGIEDSSKLPEILGDYKAQSEKIATISKELDDVNATFSMVDPDLIEAMRLNVTGEDWRAKLGVSGLDFKSNVEKLDARTLIDHFLPNQISNDDWEEYSSEDCDPNVKRLIDQSLSVAKEKFGAEKTNREAYAQEMVKEAQVKNEKHQQSVNVALEEMKAKFPRADSELLKEMSSMANMEGVLQTFFEQDGTLKKDALVNLTMAKRGLGIVSKYEAKMKREIETKVNQEILSRGADAPTVTTGNTITQPALSSEAQKKLDELAQIEKMGSSIF